MDPNKRGNPPFEASSYAAGLQRRVERQGKWIEAAQVMARDLLTGDGLDKAAAAAWWRQQLDEPQVVLSADEVRQAVKEPECSRPEGCVCGGDTPRVRAGCYYMRNPK